MIFSSMLNGAASSSRADPGLGRDADIDTDDGGLSVWRRRSLKWQERELERALEHFTFIADLTTLAPNCRFVGGVEALVAHYDGLPFTAITFDTEHTIGIREHLPANGHVAATTDPAWRDVLLSRERGSVIAGAICI
jgi:hypothetical protein